MSNTTSPDYSTYTPPANAADGVAPIYPLWLYHPTKGTQCVPDAAAQAALQASDSLWVPKDSTPTT